MGQISLYQDDKSFFSELLKAIRNSEKEILIATYTFHADRTGYDFITALSKKAEAGVRVRVIFDAIQLRHTERAAHDLLRKSGVEVKIFRPLPGMVYRHPFRFMCRNHSRVFLFDRKLFGTGGIGFANAYRNREDLSALLEITNPENIENYFNYLWELADTPHTKHIHLQNSAEIAPDLDVLYSGPEIEERQILRWVINSIRDAQRRIVIVTPFFFPSKSLQLELIKALRREVTVDLVTPLRTDRHHYDSYRALCTPLLVKNGANWWGVQNYFHEKFFIFDESWTLGSANFDLISFYRNYELNLQGKGGQTLIELEKIFEHSKTRAITAFPDVKYISLLRKLFYRTAEFFFKLT